MVKGERTNKRKSKTRKHSSKRKYKRKSKRSSKKRVSRKRSSRKRVSRKRISKRRIRKKTQKGGGGLHPLFDKLKERVNISVKNTNNRLTNVENRVYELEKSVEKQVYELEMSAFFDGIIAENERSLLFKHLNISKPQPKPSSDTSERDDAFRERMSRGAVPRAHVHPDDAQHPLSEAEHAETSEAALMSLVKEAEASRNTYRAELLMDLVTAKKRDGSFVDEQAAARKEMRDIRLTH